jgi:hypothetical protein
VGYLWGFVGPVLFALGLVVSYAQGISDDGNGGGSVVAYVLLGLGASVMATRGIRRLLDRDRRHRA